MTVAAPAKAATRAKIMMLVSLSRYAGIPRESPTTIARIPIDNEMMCLQGLSIEASTAAPTISGITWIMKYSGCNPRIPVAADAAAMVSDTTKINIEAENGLGDSFSRYNDMIRDPIKNTPRIGIRMKLENENRTPRTASIKTRTERRTITIEARFTNNSFETPRFSSVMSKAASIKEIKGMLRFDATIPVIPMVPKKAEVIPKRRSARAIGLLTSLYTLRNLRAYTNKPRYIANVESSPAIINDNSKFIQNRLPVNAKGFLSRRLAFLLPF